MAGAIRCRESWSKLGWPHAGRGSRPTVGSTALSVPKENPERRSAIRRLPDCGAWPRWTQRMNSAYCYSSEKGPRPILFTKGTIVSKSEFNLSFAVQVGCRHGRRRRGDGNSSLKVQNVVANSSATLQINRTHQRFITLHGQVQNLFRVGRHHLKAAHHRRLRERAFTDWIRRVTCAH
jgi:hypothetical protein